MGNAIIPLALNMIIDDVGWHNGRDERYKNRPSRSGLPRFHHPNDVLALNEIGKKLNMKIVCSLVIGEWDRRNVLRGVPHVTWDPEGWDAAGEMDMEYTERYFKALEESEYLDYALHGLLHGYYEDGKLVTEMHFYKGSKRGADGNWDVKWLPPEEFEEAVRLFFEIYNDWGFKKKVKTFASPCGCLGTPEDEGNKIYANILKKYGITVWGNRWPCFKESSETLEELMLVKTYGKIPWDAYDVDPRLLEISTKENGKEIFPSFVGHLTNFIRFNPENNFERVDDWANYFLKQAEEFGIMLARDIEFSAAQALYQRFAEISEDENTVTIDASTVDSMKTIAEKNIVYVSIRNGKVPTVCDGGEISLYEEKRDFKTYKIVRNGEAKITVSLKDEV